MATGPIDEPGGRPPPARDPEDPITPLGTDHDQADPGGSDKSDHPRLDALREAAIEAEFATGRVEDTVEEAQRHIIMRVARIGAGVVVTLIGLALLVLPGPGLIVVAIGLALLAQDIPFARRLLDKVEDRLPKDANGKLPKSLIVTMIATAVFFTSASLWFAFAR